MKISLHHVDDPCHAVEDEAPEDQDGELIQAFPLPLLPVRFLLFFNRSLSNVTIRKNERVAGVVLLVVAPCSLSPRLEDNLVCVSLGLVWVPDHRYQAPNCFHILNVLSSWPCTTCLPIGVSPSLYIFLLSMRIAIQFVILTSVQNRRISPTMRQIDLSSFVFAFLTACRIPSRQYFAQDGGLGDVLITDTTGHQAWQ